MTPQHCSLPQTLPSTPSLARDSRGDEPPLQGPSRVVHGQPVPAVGQRPLEPEFEHEILGALQVPQAAGGQVVRPFQLEELALAHVAVAVAAWRGERDRPPDLYQPGGETRESPPCQVLTGEGRWAGVRQPGRATSSLSVFLCFPPQSPHAHIRSLRHSFVHSALTEFSLPGECQRQAQSLPGRAENSPSRCEAPR